MISEINSLNKKASVRNQFRQKLVQFCQKPLVKSDAELKIASRLSSLLLQKVPKYPSVMVAGFYPFGDEPSLLEFYSSAPKLMAFPKITGGEMNFFSIESFEANQWAVSELGFKQPLSNHPVTNDQIEVVLVPGLAFSCFGQRLGRGKGFYDKYLTKFKGLKIGIGFDCQYTEDSLPTDDWDIKMNYIITESKCVEVKD